MSDLIERDTVFKELDETLKILTKGQIGKIFGSVIKSAFDYAKTRIKKIKPAPEVIHCKDCEWWTKQDKSLQGRCELMQMYPTGEWFCGNAQKKVTDEKRTVKR